jgi:selenocysteine lyase/cysteine desulfurase
MGPLGLGVLYIRKDRLEDLKPVFLGTGSVVWHPAFLPYKSELKPSAERFTLSTANFNDWVYFLAALEFLVSVGFDTVRQRLHRLSRHLSDGLTDIGWQVLADRFPDHRTAIVVSEKPGVSTRDALAGLQEQGIIAAERLGRIRFSPHIYNTRDQLDKVIHVLSTTD